MNARVKPPKEFKKVVGQGGNWKGGGGGSSEANDTLFSKQFARLIDVIGEGPIQGFDDPDKSIYIEGVPYENADGSKNFGGFEYEYRYGEATQDPISLFNTTETETGVNVKVAVSTGTVTRNINSTVFDGFRVRMRIAALMRVDDQGNIGPNTVQYSIKWSPAGAGTFQHITGSPFTHSHKASAPAYIDHEFDPPTDGPWDVRVERITPDEVSVKNSSDIYFDAWVGIIRQKFIYPYTAYVALKISAEQFGSSLPTRSYLVKGRIVRIPSNYNPTTRVYTGLWNGSFTLAWTDNPVWCWLDLVTNRRYGAGLADTEIDMGSLYLISQYCDELVPDGFGGTEPRYTVNVCINNREDAYSLLNKVSSAFRGMQFWTQGKLFLSQDKPEDVDYIVGPANTENGIFVYRSSTDDSRANIVYVQYNNPDDLDQPDIEIVEYNEDVLRSGPKIVEIQAWGCRSRGLARRIGEWLLYTLHHDTELISYTAGVDHDAILPGSIVAVADPIKSSSFAILGRIQEIKSDKRTVVLDRAIRLAAGTYQIMLSDNDRTVRYYTITTPAAETTQVVTTADITQAVDPGNLWMIFNQNTGTRQYRVTSVQENGGRRIVNGLLYNASKFPYIERDIPLDPPPFTPFPTGPIQPVEIFNHTVTRIINVGAANRVDVFLSWTPPIGENRVLSYEVQWADNAALNNFRTVYQGRDISFNVQNVVPGTARAARIRVNGTNGANSAWTTISSITVTSQDTTPVAPTGLAVIALAVGNSIRVSWSLTQPENFRHVELYRNTVNNFGTATLLSRETGNYFVDTNLTTGQVYYYWVRTRVSTETAANEYSATTGPQSATALAPPDWTPLDGSITAAKLADNAVTSSKIMADAIIAIKIAAGAVEEAKIAVNAVTNTKLADLSVSASKIIDGAITTAKFASGITPVGIGAPLPSTGNFEGRMWFLTTDDKLYRYTGSAWTAAVPTADLVGEVNTSQIADNAITTTKIVNNAITTLKLNDASISSAKIINGAVVNAAIANDAVQSLQILASAITNAKIATSAIDNAKLAALAVATTNIQDNAITGVKISANAIDITKFASGITPVGIGSPLPSSGNFEGRMFYLTTDDKLYRYDGSAWTVAVAAVDITGTIVTAQIADNAVTVAKVIDNAITTAKIVDNAISTIKIVDSAVVTAKINDAAINTAKIADNAVLTAKINDASISTAKIIDAAVSNIKIVDNAISTAKVQDNAVNAAKILAAAVTTTKIATGAVTSNELGASAVITSKIASGAVTNTELGALAVDAAKIANNAVTSVKIIDNAITSPKIVANAIVADKIATNAITSTKVLIGDAANVCSNGSFQSGDTSDWLPFSNPANISVVPRASAPANCPAMYAAKFTPNGSSVSMFSSEGNHTQDNFGTPVVAGEQYTISGAFARDTALTGNISMVVYFTYADGSAPTNAGTSFNSNVLTTAWQVISTNVTVPAGAVRMKYYVYWAPSAGGNLFWTNARMVRRATGELIVDGTITSSALVTDAVTADKIAAGAIVTSKLLVQGQGSAINVDPFFEDNARWTYNGVQQKAISDGPVGPNVAFSTVVSSTYFDQYKLPIDPTKTYLIELYYRRVGGTKAFFGAWKFYDASGTLIYDAGAATGWPNANAPSSNYYMPSSATNSSFTRSVLSIGPNGTAGIPAAARFMSYGFLFNNGAGTDGEQQVNHVRVTEMGRGELIVDGAIVAAKIAALAVTAGKVAANAITATEIAAGSIVTAKLATNAVTSNEIAANAIIASKILAGTITGDKLVANTITTNLIAAGAITANEIASNAVTARKVVIGDSENYVPNGSFRTGDFTDWWKHAGQPNISLVAINAVGVPTTNAPAVDYVVKYVPNAGTVSVFSHGGPHTDLEAGVPVIPGTDYRLAIDMSADAAITGVIGVYAYFRKTDGTYTTSTGLFITPTTTWQTLGLNFSVPAGANKMQLYVQWNTSGGGNVYWTNGRIYRRAAGELIVDGSIIAAHISALAVTAGKIAANAVTATEIAANAITTAKINAGAVTATEIGALAVTTGKIAANAVTATEIAAGSIVTAKLATNAVTANEIAANAITSTKILAGAVVAGKIAAAAVSTTELAANSVSARKLMVGDGYNHCPNGAFQSGDLAGWTPYIQPAQISVVARTDVGTPANCPAVYCAKYVPIAAGVSMFSSEGNHVNVNEGVPVVEGEQYQLSIDAAKDAGTITGSVVLYAYLTKSDGSALVGNSVSFGGSLSTSWQTFTVNTNIPADCVRLKLYVVWGTAGGTGNLFWTNAKINRRQTGELIVDGAITALQLSASAVTTAKLAAGAVTANELAALSVTAGKVAANAITATEIAAGSIITAKLATGAVTANEIATNAVTAVKILAAAITGDKIAANTISTREMLITDLTNLVSDPWFSVNSVSAWQGVGSGYTFGTTVSTGYLSRNTYVEKTGASAVMASLPFDSTPGDQHMLTAVVNRNTMSAGTLRLGIRYLDATGAQTGISVVSYTSADPASYTTKTVNAAAPANTTSAQLWIDTAGGTITGIARIGFASINRRATGALIVDGAITAAKIGAGEVTAGKLATDSVVAGNIVAGAITTAKIAALAITSAEIAALAITAGKIAANAVTATEIAANTITTAKMAANSITSNELAANSVIAGKVAAAAISTAELAAGAVTTDKLVVTGQGNALNVDPFFQDTARWTIAGITTKSISDGPVGAKAVYATTTQSQYFNNTLTPIDPTKTYLLELYYKRVGGDKSFFGAWHFFDAAGALIWDATAATGWPGSNSVSSNYYMPYGAANTSWLRNTLVVGPQGTAGIPAAARFISYGFLFNNSGTTNGEQQVNMVRITEMGRGEILVNGTVTALQIAANTITTAKMAANSITATELAANSVIAGKIAAGTIVAADIAASTITGAKIAAATIAGVNIVAGTISTDKLIVSDYTNLADAPYFENTAGWYNAGAGMSFVTSAGNGYQSASTYLQVTGASGQTLINRNETIAVVPGDPLLVIAANYRPSGGSGTLYIGVQFYTAAGAFVSQTFCSFDASDTQNVYTRKTTNVTVPATATKARMVVSTGTTITGNYRAGYAGLFRRMNGELIVDGAITAQKISVSTLSSIAADVGTLTAGKIQSSDGKFVIDVANGSIEWFD